MKIDLNADVGEGYDDRALVPHLTSVNVACGGHAGDARTMADTVATALEQRIAEARSGDALAAGEPTAKETPNASGERPARAINSASPTPGDDAVNAAGASATPPSRSRKRAAPTKRGSSSRRSKQS